MISAKSSASLATFTTQKAKRMSKYQSFEDLPAWQAAAQLYNAVLDLLESPQCPLTASFRHQLDRAAISVSNNIAEGFERSTTSELVNFLGIARGSAGEVRSMLAVVGKRAKVKPFHRDIERIISLAKSCGKQLTGWIESVENGPVQGKRHWTPDAKLRQQAAEKAAAFKSNFLRSLKPEHPLYNSPEARAARGEPEKD